MSLAFQDMTVGGIAVPSEAQSEAFLSWSAAPPLAGYASLGRRIAVAMGQPDTDLARAGDRLIQRLRKRDYIRHENGKWFLTDKGENLRFHLKGGA